MLNQEPTSHLTNRNPRQSRVECKAIGADCSVTAYLVAQQDFPFRDLSLHAVLLI